MVKTMSLLQRRNVELDLNFIKWFGHFETAAYINILYTAGCTKKMHPL